MSHSKIQQLSFPSNLKFISLIKPVNILIILFLPSIIYALITNYNSPLPLLQGWDIFRYSGITADILYGRSVSLFWGDRLVGSGFNLFELIFCSLDSNQFINLIILNKWGFIITNGFSTLIFYQICIKLTHNPFASLLPSLFLSCFNAGSGLGPLYFLPSSFSILFFLAILNYLLLMKKKDTDSETRYYGREKIINSLVLITLLFVSALFHLYYTLVVTMIILVILVADIFPRVFRIIFFAIGMFAITIFIEILLFNQIFGLDLLFSIYNDFISDDLKIWTFYQTFEALFLTENLLANIFFGIFSMVMLLILSKSKKSQVTISIFLILLVICFFPIKANYRFFFFLMIFNNLLISQSLTEILKVLNEKKQNLNNVLITSPLFRQFKNIVDNVRKPIFKQKKKGIFFLIIPVSIIILILPLITTNDPNQSGLISLDFQYTEAIDSNSEFFSLDPNLNSTLNFKMDNLTSDGWQIALNVTNSTCTGIQTLFEGKESSFMIDGFETHVNQVIYQKPDSNTTHVYSTEGNISFCEFNYPNFYTYSADYSVFRQEYKNAIRLLPKSSIEIVFRYDSNSTALAGEYWAIYSDNEQNLVQKVFLNQSQKQIWNKLELSLSDFQNLKKIQFITRANNSMDYLQISSIRLINSSLSSYIGTINSKVIKYNDLPLIWVNKVMNFDQFQFYNSSFALNFHYFANLTIKSDSIDLIYDHGFLLRQKYSISDIDIKKLENIKSMNNSIEIGDHYYYPEIKWITLKSLSTSEEFIDNKQDLADTIDRGQYYNLFITSTIPKSMDISVYLKTNTFLLLLYYFTYMIACLLLVYGVGKIQKRGSKSLKVSKSKIKWILQKRALKKRQLTQIFAISIGFLFLIPIYSILWQSAPKYTINKIYVSDSKTIYSSYSYQDYYAAKWIFENYNEEDVVICSDLTTDRFFYGLIGFQTDERTQNWNPNFLHYFQTCSNLGLNLNYFESVQHYYQKEVLLVLTLRLQKSIQTNSTPDRGIVDASWTNATLIEYISNTPGVQLIYYNTETWVYSVASNN